MQGLPLSIDLSQLVGRKIYAVNLARFQLTYHFEDENTKPKISLGIESEVMFTDSAGVTTHINDYRISAGQLALFIGLTIERATRADDGGLILEMSSGIRMHVMNTYPMYEAFQIYIGDKIIVA